MSAMISEKDIQDLCDAAVKAGLNDDLAGIRLERLEAGEKHQPARLPPETAAVYIFECNGRCLKVGKVNTKSNNRYQFHHYKPVSSMSNLAKALLSCPDFQSEINPEQVGDWIRQNTNRYNILIPASLGKKFVHFAEAFFILKCDPQFEDGT